MTWKLFGPKSGKEGLLFLAIMTFILIRLSRIAKKGDLPFQFTERLVLILSADVVAPTSNFVEFLSI